MVPLDETAASQALIHADWVRGVGLGCRRVHHSAGALNPQIASLATAVHGPGGKPLGALVMSGPIGRVLAADLVQLAGVMAGLAQELSGILGAPDWLGSDPPELVVP